VNDCAGICDGTALHGDLNLNLAQEVADGQLYMQGIVGTAPSPTTCNDLNADGDITVSDAALINACALRGNNYPLPGGGFRDYCDFPEGVLNTNDTVGLRIAAIDFVNNTIDIEISNRYDRVVGYQFELTGVTLSSAVNLVPAADYPEMPQFNPAGMVACVSNKDSAIYRSNAWKPLVRLGFNNITGPQVCINQIVDIVNSDYEDVITRIDGTCLSTVGQAEATGPYAVKVYPNPFAQSTTLEFTRNPGQQFELQVTNLAGQVVRDYGKVVGNRVTIARGELPAGLYLYHLKGNVVQTGKLMVK
jgi:hypothetical protein